MADETRAVPAIAATAIQLALADRARVENAIATQTLDVMGLSPNDGWKVDLAKGLAFREVKEEEKKAA